MSRTKLGNHISIIAESSTPFARASDSDMSNNQLAYMTTTPHTHIHTHTHTHIYIHTTYTQHTHNIHTTYTQHTHIHTHTYIHICTHIHMHTYTHIRTHTHTRARAHTPGFSRSLLKSRLVHHWSSHHVRWHLGIGHHLESLRTPGVGTMVRLDYRLHPCRNGLGTELVEDSHVELEEEGGDQGVTVLPHPPRCSGGQGKVLQEELAGIGHHSFIPGPVCGACVCMHVCVCMCVCVHVCTCGMCVSVCVCMHVLYV